MLHCLLKIPCLQVGNLNPLREWRTPPLITINRITNKMRFQENLKHYNFKALVISVYIVLSWFILPNKSAINQITTN